jgi:hypothetical protein
MTGMNVEQAMIIKTNSSEQTELVQQLRKNIKAKGQDVVLVPYGVNALFITMVKNDPVVILKHYVGPDEAEDIDIAKGFDTLYECWQYARLVVSEAKLQEHIISTDIPE